jgi:hypothetical protein
MATDFLRMVQGDQRRDVILEAEVHYLEKMRQEAQVRVVNPPSRTYTLICDEGAHMGGDDSAPPPLAFLLAGVIF